MKTANIKVLLADDNEEDAVLIRTMLAQSRQSAFVVDHAVSYDQAKALLAKNSYDVCLVDMQLDNNHTGMEIMQASHSAGFKGPSIILTGTEDPDTETLAIHTGAAEYLIKGQFDAEVLDRVIRHALERQADIQALKAADDNLRRARDELEERVQRRTEELSKAVAALQAEITRRVVTEKQLRDAILQLERINKAKSEFVANVSHELKTPITSIMYGTRNLLKGIAGPLPEQAVRYLNMFDSECDRLVNTINHILDLGKLDNDALTISPITVPLRRLISRSLDPLRLQADAARVGIEVGPMQGADFVRCDPGLIQRVLQNVFSNAIKYTPAQGQITVQAGVPDTEPGMAEVRVTDNGIGIPANALQRVTERYFRVGSHVSGTGLGLAISKEIVLLHGGRLDIVSPPPSRPNGTQVSILLPLATPPLILVANDNLTMQALLQAQLTTCGYIVDTVTGGAELLLRAGKTTPGLILLDMLLEDMHGHEVIIRIKESPRMRHVPIVATTGSALDEITADVLQRFTIPTLRKPWQVEELTAAVESALMGMTVFQPLRREEPT